MTLVWYQLSTIANVVVDMSPLEEAPGMGYDVDTLISYEAEVPVLGDVGT